MEKRGKKYIAAADQIEKTKLFTITEGIEKVKKASYASFDATISANVMLGINVEKSDQSVRGSVIFPHKFGAPIRIVAVAKGEQADLAISAGAIMVGADDIIDKILGGWLDFDYMVATPDLMGLVGKVAKILGPRGILPSKKNNTVALDLVPVIVDLMKGLSFFKNDKGGQVNFSFGKCSLSAVALEDNLRAFMQELVAAKPSTSKGIFLKKCSLSVTMGPGVSIDTSGFAKAR